MGRPKHPSGKPIHRENKRGRGFWNTPNNGPATPRLQQPQPKDAIGFHRLADDTEGGAVYDDRRDHPQFKP